MALTITLPAAAQRYARRVLEHDLQATVKDPQTPLGASRGRFLEVCAKVRGLTDNLDFSRNPSTGRSVEL